MGGIFGGGSSNANSEPAALGIRVQTSAYGMAIPLVYGRTRIAANLLWYGDFVATAHETSGGKGGGGVIGTTYTYKASVMFGLCEGEIAEVYSAWLDKSWMDKAALLKNYTLFNGTYPQTPWSYLLTKHGGEALGYQGVAYAARANYDLGTSSSLPNHSFEVSGKCAISATSGALPLTFPAPSYGADIALTVTGGYNLFINGHASLKIGDTVEFFTTGTLPAGLELGKQYSVASLKNTGTLSNPVYLLGVANQSTTGLYGGKALAWSNFIKLSSTGTGALTLKKVTRSDALVSTAHGKAVGSIVYLGGSLPPNFKSGIEYHVVYATADILKLSTTKGGQPIMSQAGATGTMFTATIGGNPRDILADFLTSKTYGAEFAAEKLGDMSAYSAYCAANGFSMSPAYVEQKPAHEMLTDMMTVTNAATYFSEGLLKFTPLSDESVTANGASYYAPNVAIYDLTDDDFIVTDGDPLKMYRNSTADAFNQVQIEFVNKLNQYNVEIATASDQTSIDTYGLRALEPIVAHMITDAATARRLAQMILQRRLFVRNTFEFTLSWKYCLLEPTDIITITDEALGLVKYPVRIVSTEENDDGQISVVAEDYPSGVTNSAVYPSNSGIGWTTNANAPAGNVAAPAFFEVAATKSLTGLAVGIAVAGMTENYGGCQVWVSYDGASYSMLGEVKGSSRYGVTTNDVTSAVGQAQGVQLAGNGGTILGGSALDAQNLATACLVGDEYVAYTTATLTAENAYTLTLDNRGALNTPAAAHLTGSKFIRIDKQVLVGDDLDLSMIGKTLYFKFLSFNQYAGAIQALADVAEYTYTITGVMAKLPPSDVTSFAVTSHVSGVVFTWGDVADGDRKDYELRQGASWATAVSHGFYGSNSASLPPQPAGSSTWLVKARDVFGNMSSNAASVALTVNAPAAPVVSAAVAGADYALSWTAPASGFTIDHYELRVGTNWATGTSLGTSGGQVFQAPVNWGGVRDFMVAAVDVAGNVGAVGYASLTILLATAPTVTAQVIDNNILFYWNDTAATLPIATYELRKGATFATAQVIGTKSGHFTSYFETNAGTFTYWVVPIDSAGNYGTEASVSATMSQPPDYFLKADYDSTLAGTLSNAVKGTVGIVMPINTAELYGDHFTTRGWSTPQDQIDAGFPLWIEPSSASGYYEEVFDYGTVLAASKVTATPNVSTSAGTPTVTTTISLSSDGAAWTDYVGVTEVFGTNFRYVKVRVTADSVGGDDLVTMSALNVRLDVKLKNDAGSIAVLSTDNDAAITGAGAGGKTVLFNVPFISVTSITLSAQGTTVAYTPIYDFNGSTVNPVGFKIYLFDSAGNRASGTVSWSVKGY